MRILLEETYAPLADQALAGHDLAYFASRTTPRPEVESRIQGAEALVLRWPLSFGIDRAFLTQARDLKHIHKSGTGLEHQQVLDLQAVQDLGILFSNNAGLNADVVAEHAVLLTLLALRAPTLGQAMAARQGIWSQALPPGAPAATGLAGKVVGIVGLGQIGTAIASRMRGMGAARILGHQRQPRFEQEMLLGLEWRGLDALLAEADVIVLALPITPATAGLIDARRIALMRPEASLINVGRGGVLDEAALYAALSQGRLRAAGLDVLAEEPSQSPIMGLPNVIVTPHTAGTATEMQARQLSGSIEAVGDFLAGRRPRRLANPAVLSLAQLRAPWLAPEGQALQRAPQA